jgi:Contractile injection system tube protein/LysM domain
MVMDAVGSAASQVGQALGLVKPDKAKLVCVGSNLPKEPHSIECMFNPTEYTLTQTLNVSRNQAAAKPGGTAQFTGTNAMTLTTKLFFDDFSSPEGDVTPKISALLSWTHPTPDSLNKKPPAPCPPLVSFVWGGNKQLENFAGYLKNVTVNYTVFRKDGTPVQATVTITIEGEPETIGPQNPTSHAIDSRRTHTMIDGDTLQSIAFQELGKPAYWRAIADLNGIDDPLRLPAGTVLLIPTVADATRRA